MTEHPEPATPDVVETVPSDADMCDSFTFALIAEVNGADAVVGTHTTYCQPGYGVDHWDGGLALSDHSPGELAARGFGWRDGHFADSCQNNGNGTFTVTWTDYDTDAEHAMRLPLAVDGVIFVTLDHRRTTP